MSEEKKELIERVAIMFTQKSEEEKAFILGYMVATEQHKEAEQAAAGR